MIRQAISCDICGAEKKQTNHWFVVHAQAGELRITGWNTQGRPRAGSKHLCGQTCLHKLVDEFIAGSGSARVQPSAGTIDIDEPIAATDISLTSSTAYASREAPARTYTPAPPPRPMAVIPAAVIAISPSRTAEEPRPLMAAPLVDDTPGYTSRHGRAEAWKRERERELRATEQRNGIAARRKSS